MPYDSIDWNAARNQIAKEDLYYPHPMIQVSTCALQVAAQYSYFECTCVPETQARVLDCCLPTHAVSRIKVGKGVGASMRHAARALSDLSKPDNSATRWHAMLCHFLLTSCQPAHSIMLDHRAHLHWFVIVVLLYCICTGCVLLLYCRT
jgi:hypothetical protein